MFELLFVIGFFYLITLAGRPRKRSCMDCKRQLKNSENTDRCNPCQDKWNSKIASGNMYYHHNSARGEGWRDYPPIS